MKQSGRCVLPAIHPLMSFSDFIHSANPDSVKLIPHENVEIRTIGQVLQAEQKSSVCLCIGPEGGFSDQEIDRAEKAGFLSVGLGPRRLRTETAAIVAVASVLM